MQFKPKIEDNGIREKKPGPKPGSPRTGGRAKGTPNKVTLSLRNSVNSFLKKNMKDLQANYNQLEAKDKLAFIEKLLKYVLPQKQQTQIDFSQMTEDQLDQIIKNLNS